MWLPIWLQIIIGRNSHISGLPSPLKLKAHNISYTQTTVSLSSKGEEVKEINKWGRQQQVYVSNRVKGAAVKWTFKILTLGQQDAQSWRGL